MMNSNNESTGPRRRVKLEIDEAEQQQSPRLNKKPKTSPPFHQELWSSRGTSTLPPPPPLSQCTASSSCPLDEPSPLGLRLRKSPSLLDLIQMRLSNPFTTITGASSQHGDAFELAKKDLNFSTASIDKLKASNFPASLLRIGSWEYVSRHEGDLVAKCYFAKHKLVWEVLEGGLKSKIEIQWSDITSLKANYCDDVPGTLDIVLARRPLFFRETNPQPRKHTLWQATSDFTGGQASVHRRHFLQCQHGLLSKHFEKLIQCDPRLNSLSRQPEIVLNSPYFEVKGSIFEGPDESEFDDFDQLKSVSTFPGHRDAPSSSAARSPSLKKEVRESVDSASEHLSRETPSSSVTEENGSIKAEESEPLEHRGQLKLRGLHVSMSMSDLVSHIGHCISEQMISGNPLDLGERLQNGDMLEEITQYLLSDSQLAPMSDEKSLMSRVDSLCCLLQKNPTSGQNLQVSNDWADEDYRDDQRESSLETKFGDIVTRGPTALNRDGNNTSECKQKPVMSRSDSVGDLLLNLPRIASLPQFLFNIAEDRNNKAR